MYLRERITDVESARDEHPKDSQAWRALNEPLNAMRREANRLSLRADEFAAEPQGEPSDDGHLITDCEHGVNSLYDRCAPCEAIEQGEPSDAQVRAAVNAWHRTGGTGCEDWYDNPINRERMRLALRAAGVGGVR